MNFKGVYQDMTIILDQKPEIKDGTEVFVDIKEKNDLIPIKAWKISDQDIQDLTPIKARDLLISCFIYAHLEEAINKKKKRFTYTEYDTIKESLTAEIRMCFSQINADFDNPTKTNLLNVLNTLAEKQINRGASKVIINSHRTQLNLIFNKL